MNTLTQSGFIFGLLLLSSLHTTFLCGMEYAADSKRNSLSPEIVGSLTVVGGAHLCNQLSTTHEAISLAVYGIETQGQITKDKKCCEDRIQTINNFLPGCDFHVVCDGHGGIYVAEYITKNLHNKVATLLEKGSSLKNALENAFLEIDKELKDIWDKKGFAVEGSTASVVVVNKETSEAYLAHVGDSRVCIVRDGTIVHATKDHNTDNTQECEAVKNRGGFIFGRRVNATLKVTRSFGDFGCGYAKNGQKVISVQPDVAISELKAGDTIVLASDGLWHEVTNEQVALETLDKNKSAEDIVKALKAKLSVVYSDDDETTTFSDDVSIIVIQVR